MSVSTSRAPASSTHLRELLAAGIVTQPRRSAYAIPDRAVIPLLTLIACAHDLAP